MFKHSLSVVPLLFALSLAEFESHQQPYRRDSWSLSGGVNSASGSDDSYNDDVSIPSYSAWPSALSGGSKIQQNPEDNLLLYGYYNYISPELATAKSLLSRPGIANSANMMKRGRHRHNCRQLMRMDNDFGGLC